VENLNDPVSTLCETFLIFLHITAFKILLTLSKIYFSFIYHTFPFLLFFLIQDIMDFTVHTSSLLNRNIFGQFYWFDFWFRQSGSSFRRDYYCGLKFYC